MNTNREPPSVEDLKTLYESELYKNLLSEFAQRSNREFDNREQEAFEMFHKLIYCQRRYLILGISFKEVLSALEKNRDHFLVYQLAATSIFDNEESSEFEKSDLIGVSGIDKTYLIERFCEFYLLQIGDRERIMYYLRITKKAQHIRKYLEQITKLYHETLVGSDNARCCPLFDSE
jgi:hypothetical protein